MFLPPVPLIDLIAERLPLIFPEGTEHRAYLIRDSAVRAVYVMFYAGAIEGNDQWIKPSQVTGMSDDQAALTDAASRESWVRMSLGNKKWRPANAWYASDSREGVRDESLKKGLIPLRAVVKRTGIATTANVPTYALELEFSKLFDENLVREGLSAAIASWQNSHLSKTAVARQRLVRHGATVAMDAVTVTFPNGEIRNLAAGPSSIISKAVIEVFAPRFLKQPIVLWLSESGNKVVARDETLANEMGLKIDASKALPDIILVDMGVDTSGAEMLVVFAEVVASDGPVDRQRKIELTSIALEAGFDEHHLAFLTAYLDRANRKFTQSIPNLAWGSFAWCASEPEHIIELKDSGPWKLSRSVNCED